jgi:hypothetical protein
MSGNRVTVVSGGWSGTRTLALNGLLGSSSRLVAKGYRFPARTAHRTGNSAARSGRALILTPMLGPAEWQSAHCRVRSGPAAATNRRAGWQMRSKSCAAGNDQRTSIAAVETADAAGRLARG